MSNVQAARGQQTHGGHLPNHGRHHRETFAARLRDCLLPRVEAQTHLAHPLRARGAREHEGAGDSTRASALRHGLLADVDGQGEGKFRRASKKTQLCSPANLVYS